MAGSDSPSKPPCGGRLVEVFARRRPRNLAMVFLFLRAKRPIALIATFGLRVRIADNNAEVMGWMTDGRRDGDDDN